MPSASLDYDTTYIVRLYAGVSGMRNAAGFSQVDCRTWTFIIKGLDDVGPLVYHCHIIDDDGASSGNSNGDIDPGEAIQLRVFFGNYGSFTASSVSGQLSIPILTKFSRHNQQCL